MTGQVARLQQLDGPATWLLVSCGGNDVLSPAGQLQTSAHSVLDAAETLAAWQADFRHACRRMPSMVLSRRKPVAVCTVCDAVPGLLPGVCMLLAPFSDVIVREAAARRLPVLDLRLVCTGPADYAASSPVGPSAAGGRKIAQAIADLILAHDTRAPRTVVYGAGTGA